MRYLVIIISLLTFGCQDLLEYDFDLSEYDYEFVYELSNETKEIHINDTTTRYVKTTRKDVKLYLSEYADQWNESYVDSDEPRSDYCGPTAVKNMMSWYGQDFISYEDIGRDMKVNRGYITGSHWAKCAAICTGEILFCTNICLKIVEKKALQQGTNIKHLKKYLENKTPEGYTFNHTVGDPSMIAEILQQLLNGNPVVINELVNPEVVGGPDKDMLHTSVLTGLVIERGVIHVTMANSYKRPLRRFMEDWSLERLGSKARRRIASKLGARPFEAMWYEKSK